MKTFLDFTRFSTSLNFAKSLISLFTFSSPPPHWNPSPASPPPPARCPGWGWLAASRWRQAWTPLFSLAAEQPAHAGHCLDALGQCYGPSCVRFFSPGFCWHSAPFQSPPAVSSWPDRSLADSPERSNILVGGKDGKEELSFQENVCTQISTCSQILRAGPSLMLMADMRWSAWRSIRACPSISCTMKSST